MTQHRRILATLAIAVFAALSVPTAATAEEPVDLGPSDIHDSAGALGPERDRVEDALETLYDDAGIQLVVVYVETFEGAASPSEWAQRTADLNGLGSNDVLLAVAITDRNYVTWYPDDFALSEGKTLAIEQDSIEPALRDGEWADAAVAAADGLARSSAGFNWIPVIGGAVVVVGGIWGFTAFRRHRSATAQRRGDAERLAVLEQQASVALVRLDDELITSEEELGFAAAQFGDAATQPFRAAIEMARAKTMEAFALKQRLEDTVEETDAERAAMAERIVTLTGEGDAALDAQAAAFAELRQLEKNAPQALAAAATGADAVEARVEASARLVSTLRDRYAASALTAVADNPAQAAELIAFAATARADAQAAIDRGSPSEAAVHVRAAQTAIAQVTQLLDATDALAAELTDASSRLDAAQADTRAGLAEAQSLSGDPRLGSATESLAQAIATASAAVSAASQREAIADPVASLGALLTADAQLDRVLATVREEQARIARARQQLPASITRATNAIDHAAAFITTRRGAVGEHARTRLAQAERLRADAIASAETDPAGAVETALTAATTAEGALASARADVESRSSPFDIQGSGLDGASVGGLLGDLFFGGSSSRGSSWGGGWGGSSGGGFTSGRSSRGSSNSRRSSSSGRSRSRSSGRSSGSRGRTGGGRF